MCPRTLNNPVSGKLKGESDTFFDASQRRRGQPSQRRIDYGLFVQGRDLVAFCPRVSGESAIPRPNSDSQCEPPMMNRGDRDDADIQGVPVQCIIRNNQGRTTLVEAQPVDLAPLWVPPSRNLRHAQPRDSASFEAFWYASLSRTGSELPLEKNSAASSSRRSRRSSSRARLRSSLTRSLVDPVAFVLAISVKISLLIVKLLACLI